MQTTKLSQVLNFLLTIKKEEICSTLEMMEKFPDFKGNAYTTMGELAEEGYIRLARKGDPRANKYSDGRVKPYVLTEKGEEYLLAIYNDFSEVYAF